MCQMDTPINKEVIQSIIDILENEKPYVEVSPSTSVVNNYITDNSIHDDHSIKTKNSNINSNGATISNENNIGLHIHLSNQQ